MNTVKTVAIATVVALAVVGVLSVSPALAQVATPWGPMNGGMLYRYRDGSEVPGGNASMMGSGSMRGQGFGSMQAMHDWMSQTGDMHSIVWDSLAQALDLTPDALQALLAEGESLSDIAAAQGTDEAELASVLEAAMRSGLTQAVAEGALTQDQADQMLAQMAGRYAWMIEHIATGQMGAGMMTGGITGSFGAGGCHNAPAAATKTDG